MWADFFDSTSLKKHFEAMIPDVVCLSEPDLIIVNKILIRTQELIDSRNDIIHSTWFVGWGSSIDTDFSVAVGQKLICGEFGVGVKHLKWKSEHFDKMSKNCDEVKNLIYRLWYCISGEFKISKNFKINKTGDVFVP